MVEREVAFKTDISSLVKGKYVKQEGWKPNYILTENNWKISRVNIIATIVSKAEKEMVVDDGSGTMTIRAFNENNTIKNFELGDVVKIIGRPREFSQEKYIVPEIIKKIENKKWIDVRKKVLALQKPPERKIQEPEKPKEVKRNKVVDDIYRVIRELDKGDGVDIEDILVKCENESTEDIINELLAEGEIFEVRAGRIKLLE